VFDGGPRPRFSIRMLPLWGAEPNRRAPVITTFLVVLNFSVFAYEVLLSTESQRALL
jgi:hypothetical protein